MHNICRKFLLSLQEFGKTKKPCNDTWKLLAKSLFLLVNKLNSYHLIEYIPKNIIENIKYIRFIIRCLLN